MSDDLLFRMCDVACLRAWNGNGFDELGWGPIHRRLMTMCLKRENSGRKKQMGLTQNQRIINHLKRTGTITQREALIEYSIQSLTKRISELRDDGYDIRSKVKHHPITKQKYVRYEMAAAK